MNKTIKFSDYFNMDVTLNATEIVDTVPISNQEFVIGLYSVLFIIGAVGNVAVFFALIRSRRRKSRVNLLMTHLVVADLIVTFIVIPLEVSNEILNINIFARYIKLLLLESLNKMPNNDQPY